MDDYKKISLKDLFSQNKDKHTEARVGVVDGKVTNIPDINLGELKDSVIQKEEGVIKVSNEGILEDFYTLGSMSYEEYVRKSKEEQTQEEINQMTESIRRQEIVNEIFADFESEGLALDQYLGYNKLGVNRQGEPYIKAVLANQFEQLNTRRFLTREEYERVVNISKSHRESEAVVNKKRSIKEMITLNIKKEEDLVVLTIEIVDKEGERIPYLEQKLDYIREMGVSPQYWVVYLKTKFEFEDDYKTLSELKDKEFNA